MKKEDIEQHSRKEITEMYAKFGIGYEVYAFGNAVCGKLEERFRGTDFFRASKSVILNLSKIKNLTPALGGRFEAAMKNREKILISRQYVPILKEKLGL